MDLIGSPVGSICLFDVYLSLSDCHHMLPARRARRIMMLLADLRGDVARYAKKMVASHLVRAAQGNLSARDAASGLICITPSGMDYDLITAEDIVVLDRDGSVAEG